MHDARSSPDHRPTRDGVEYSPDVARRTKTGTETVDEAVPKSTRTRARDSAVAPSRIDEKRLQWTADDIIRNRPALSRWRPEFAEAFARHMDD